MSRVRSSQEVLLEDGAAGRAAHKLKQEITSLQQQLNVAAETENLDVIRKLAGKRHGLERALAVIAEEIEAEEDSS